MSLLLEARANPNLPDEGDRAIHVSSWQGDKKVTTMLPDFHSGKGGFLLKCPFRPKESVKQMAGFFEARYFCGWEFASKWKPTHLWRLRQADFFGWC